MVQKYRKKPVVIKAIQWTGDNQEEVKNFVKSNIFFTSSGNLYIETLEGEMRVPINSYIIRGINDEYYGCHEDVFNKTYELI